MKHEATPAKPRQYHQGVRAQSAEATARRIVDAFLGRLMEQWFDEITLDSVAEDAGVTVQTVVRRFGGKKGLLAEAVLTLEGQINATRATPTGDVGRLVRHLLTDYERTGDMLIRLLALEPRHPGLKEFLEVGRRCHREWVAGVLAAELGKLGAAQGRAALDALIIATDVYTWKLLRRDMGRSLAATGATMRQLIEAVVSQIARTSGEHP